MQNKEMLRLVGRVRQGDTAAFELIFNELYNSIYYLALKMTNSAEDAQDIVQNTFTKVFTQIGQLNDDRAFVSWLQRIAVNECNSFLSANNKFQTDPEGLSDEIALDDLSVYPEEAYLKQERQEAIMGVIDTLPSAQKMAVLLYYYYGNSIKEIATATNTTDGTIKKHLYRAKQAIRAKLRDNGAFAFIPFIGIGKLISADAEAYSAIGNEIVWANVAASAEAIASVPINNVAAVGTVAAGGILSTAIGKAACVAVAAGVAIGGTHLAQQGTEAAPPVPPVAQVSQETPPEPPVANDLVSVPPTSPDIVEENSDPSKPHVDDDPLLATGAANDSETISGEIITEDLPEEQPPDDPVEQQPETIIDLRWLLGDAMYNSLLSCKADPSDENFLTLYQMMSEMGFSSGGSIYSAPQGCSYTAYVYHHNGYTALVIEQATDAGERGLDFGFMEGTYIPTVLDAPALFGTLE